MERTPADHRPTARGLPNRGGRFHRGIRQGKSRTGAAVSHHARPYADHHHLSGPLDLRDDDGVRHRTAGPHRGHSNLAAVPAAVRHQRAGRPGRTFRDPDAQHAHPDRQIRTNEKEGLAPFDAVVEATVQRSRPVILTALAAMLAFIPLTQSVFWGTLAYTLIGGT